MPDVRCIGLLIASVAMIGPGLALAGPRDAPAVGPPAVLPGPDVSDAFAGFYGGLAFGTVDGTLANPAPTSALNAGQAIGLVGGYNWQRGALVFGGEVRATHTPDLSWPAGGGVDAYQTLYDLRGRAGYAAGDVFVYGALGYSWGTATPDTPSAVESDGMNFGIGVEYNLSERMFLGADLSRRDLGGASGLEADIDTFTLTGGFRF